MKIINKDICEADTQYIAHQTNLISVSVSGVAKAIFDKFPYANTYSDRFLRNYVADPNQLGTIEIYQNIINMNAQFYPGKFSNKKVTNNLVDTEKHRQAYFHNCLKHISKIENLQSIAFPYLIGCGLAQGNWNIYYSMLEEFTNNVDAQVYLYKL